MSNVAKSIETARELMDPSGIIDSENPQAASIAKSIVYGVTGVYENMPEVTSDDAMLYLLVSSVKAAATSMNEVVGQFENVTYAEDYSYAVNLLIGRTNDLIDQIEADLDN